MKWNDITQYVKYHGKYVASFSRVVETESMVSSRRVFFLLRSLLWINVHGVSSREYNLLKGVSNLVE